MKWKSTIKNGDIHILKVSESPVFDPDGSVIAIEGITHDITAIKKAENDIKFKNILLSTQLETSLDGIFVVDEKGRIISFNQRFIDMWDIPDEVIETKKDDLVLQFTLEKVVDPKQVLTRILYLYDHQNEKSIDEIYLTDGRILNSYSSPIFMADGSYIGKIWYFSDITRLKAAEKKARESERTLFTLIGNLQGMVYRCLNDLDWTMQFVSNGCFALTGYSPSDLIKNHKIAYNDIIHPDDQTLVQAMVHQALAQKKTLCNTLPHSDGQRRNEVGNGTGDWHFFKKWGVIRIGRIHNRYHPTKTNGGGKSQTCVPVKSIPENGSHRDPGRRDCP